MPDRTPGRAPDRDREETPAQRRRRLDEVFGDVLPDTTSDERGDGTDDPGTDAWLRAQVPPHHGG